MTSEEWWRVGSRLLGVYFMVLGALSATGSLMMLGVGLPEGTNRSIAILTPLIQGIISAGAGVWLLSQSAGRATGQNENVGQVSGTFRQALQLLGIFFVVTGTSELVKTVIDSYFISADFAIRASNVASGLVNASAGALLVLMPARVAEKLEDVRR